MTTTKNKSTKQAGKIYSPPKNKGKFAKTVERLWDGVPVADAENDLRIIIKPCDVSSAVQKDPGHCVFARACKRSFGTKKVLFLRTIAYVELPDDKGQMKVERFAMSQSVQQLISNFDKGDKVIPQGGFLLLAPSSSSQLGYQREYKEACNKRKKEALLRGESVMREGGSESPHKPRVIDFEVRNGSGMVHFS
jgi:hypothetical protein